MKSKKMKVLYTARAKQTQHAWGRESYYSATPKISMEGKWLDALGFHIGDAIQVSYEDNCIRITPAPEPVMVCDLEQNTTLCQQENPERNNHFSNDIPDTGLPSWSSYHDRVCRDSASSLHPRTVFHPHDAV